MADTPLSSTMTYFRQQFCARLLTYSPNRHFGLVTISPPISGFKIAVSNLDQLSFVR
jgi:hypothetical protein